MSNKGIVVFANNNDKIDYVKQCVDLAKRAKKYLNLPVSIITDCADYVKTAYDISVFDQIISINPRLDSDVRRFKDGTLAEHRSQFKNNKRARVYNLSPYDETIVMDSDVVICNDHFKYAFDSDEDFLIYDDSTDLSIYRTQEEFEYISETSVKFYWATVFFFRKTEKNKMFFELVDHIETNFSHYCKVYQLRTNYFRNDFGFSIAIHIMNGFQAGDFAHKMPGRLFHILDSDLLQSMKNEHLVFLLEKEDYLGEYTLAETKDLNVHVMNKFSLMRELDKEPIND
jgi:hypothetical protein